MVVLFVCSSLVADEAPQAKREADAVLSGRIVDEDGDPVTDARLTLSGPDSQRAETDKDGFYAFESISKAGNYRVRISSKRWVSQLNYSKLQLLNLTPKSRATQNFTLQKAAQVQVRTVDEDGNPVRGVTITIASMADERYRNTQGVGTDSDGRAIVGGVKPSEVKYILGFRHRNYAIEKLIVRLKDSDEGELHTVTMRKGITVTGTAVCSDGKPPGGWRILALPNWWHFGVYPNGEVITNEGVFELKHIVPGEYNVTIAVPHGEGGSQPRTVLQDDLVSLPQPLSVKMDYPSPASLAYIAGTATLIGKPDGFRGVWLHARSTDGKYTSGFYLRQGKSEFRIGPVPKGKYDIEIASPVLEPVNLKDVNAPTKDMKVELSVRGKPTLKGSIAAPGGGKLKDLKVSIFKLRTLQGPNYAEDAGWRSLDPADGRFSIAVNSPGIYVVTAKAEGFAPTSSPQINTTDKEQKPIRLVLNKGLPLRGIVVDASDQPVARAKIQMRSLAGKSSSARMRDFQSDEGAVYSDDNGEFLIPNLATEPDALKVTKKGYCFTRLEQVNVKDYTEKPLRIRLTEGGEIRGLVFDGKGNPVVGAVLHFQDGFHGSDYERGNHASTTTDTKGFYRVRNLPEQPIYITCGDEWNGSGVVRRTVVPKDGGRLTVHFGGSAKLTGRLKVNGKWAADTRVQLGGWHEFSGIGKAFARTDADGRFTFFGAPPGLWTLYYGEGTQPTEWARVREIEVGASSTGDVGEIDHVSGSVIVKADVSDPEQRAQMNIGLSQLHEFWHAGQAVGKRPRGRNNSEDQRFDHVPVGNYEIVCRQPSQLVTHHPVSVTSETPTQEFTIPVISGTASIAGTVEPGLLKTTYVDFWHENERWHVNTRIKESGEIAVSNLPAGRWTLRASGLRTGPGIFTVNLKDGEKKSIEITKENAMTSAPFGYATIDVQIEPSLLTPARTELIGSQGLAEPLNRYKAETDYFIPAGEYECVVSLPGFKTYREKLNVKPYDPEDKSGRLKKTIKLQKE